MCGQKENIRKMVYCLAEAAKQLDRRFLKKCYTAAIVQDVRKSRLLIRYKAATLDLQVRRGVLGQTKLTDQRAEHLKDATLRVLRTFCTRHHGTPWRPAKGKPAKLDKSLLTHVVFPSKNIQQTQPRMSKQMAIY